MQQPKHSSMPQDQLHAYPDAYRQMVERAQYRPHVREHRSTVEQEAIDYALAFYGEEENHNGFLIGTSSFSTCRIFIWTIEAARQLACGSLGLMTACKLLEMAAMEAKQASEQPEFVNFLKMVEWDRKHS